MKKAAPLITTTTTRARRARPFRVPGACRRVLLAFHGQKSLSLGDVAARIKRTRSAACRSLKWLYRHDCIQRVRITNSRNSLVYYTSSKGLKLRNVWLNQN